MSRIYFGPEDFVDTDDWSAEDKVAPLADLLAQARAKARNDWEKSFVESVNEQYDRRGSLSAKQVEILKRIVAYVPAPAAKQDSGLNLASVPSGRYAVPGGDTRLKIEIKRVVDSSSKFVGWTFVRDAAEYGQGQKYGQQRPGQSYVGKIVAELRAIAADPFAASVAYGKLVGRCGVCGRHLEDEESVARGIGPRCRAKFGV